MYQPLAELYIKQRTSIHLQFTMAEVSSKKLVTEGDSKINVITALGELKHLSSCISKSIFHLHEYVDDKLEPTLHKNVIIKQIKLLIRSQEFVSEKVTYITKQEGVKKISTRTQDMIRAAENIQEDEREMSQSIYLTTG